MDAVATRRAERAGLVAFDAFRPAVKDLKVVVFGPIAVTTFAPPYELVSAGEFFKADVRATVVWVQSQSGWKVVREHFSPPPTRP
jgi:ketosteroid isomerase-like protein